MATSEYRPHLLCRILGCKCGDDYGACVRCGLDDECGYVYPDKSLLWPVYREIWGVRSLIWDARNPPRCEVCGKRIGWMRRSIHRYTCSPECEEKWIPF